MSSVLSVQPERSIKDTDLRRLLLKYASASFRMRVAGAGFTFLIGIQLARMLGSEGYGHYGLVMSIIAVFSVPAQFGFPELVVREANLAKLHDQWHALKGLLIWASSLNVLISVLIACLVAVWLAVTTAELNSVFNITLLTGLLLMPILGQIALRESCVRGLQHIVSGQLPSAVIRPAIFSALLAMTALLSFEISAAVAMALGVGSALAAMVFGIRLQQKVAPESLMQSKAEFKSRPWIRSCIPMALTNGMRVIQGHMSTLVLGAMLTASAVGLFRVANSVALVMAIPITMATLIGAPMIARLDSQGDRSGLQELLTLLSIGMTVSTGLMLLPFVFAGKELLSFFFGTEFGASAEILIVLGMGVMASSVFGVAGTLLNMTGHERKVTSVSVQTLILLLLAAPLLSSLFGVVGAAWANTLSMLWWRYKLWWEAKRVTQLDSSLFSILWARTPVL